MVSAAKFSIGDIVEVYNTGSSGLLVRGPNACDSQIGGKFDGSRGVVLAGPVFCNSYNRWKIRWNGDNLEGWSAEDYLKKVVNQPPSCSLSANPKSGKAPLTVTFSMSANDPDGSVSAWVLDVNGDGNADYSGYGNPPSTKGYTYTNSGNYNAALMVSDNNGAYASDVETINVGSQNQPPSCSLSANPKSGKAPLTVTFSMSASDPDGSISTWLLNVGDGNSYSGSGNPPSTKSHTYTNQGNYDAVLAVSDNNDATDFATETINVEPPTQLPIVTTSAPSNIDSTSAILNGNLDSTGGETCEVWFEYGLTVSYGQTTPEQSKSSTGSFSESIFNLNSGTTYHFKACASNSKGTVCGSDKEFNTPKPVNHPPNPPTNVAQFKSDLATEIPIGGVIEEGLVFLKANISDPDGDRLKLQIELRQIDDNFVQRFTQQSSLVNISRVSVAAYGLTNGNYHWQARTVDEYGLTSGWVSFGNNPELAADVSIKINYLPIAIFTYSPKYPEVGEEITFNASPSYDPDGGALSYEWDFGDGDTAEGEYTTHVYSETGGYIVSLYVIDDEGTKSEYSFTLGVFSTELTNSIDKMVNSTKISLNNLLSGVSDVANAADYFEEAVTNDKQELVGGLALDIFKGALSFFKVLDIKKVSALSIGQSIKLAERYPNLANVLNDYGWVISESVKDSELDAATEIVKGEIIDRLKSNSYSYSNTFYPDLQTKNRNRRNNITALKNEVVNSIGNLSQEEIDLYKKDIQKRAVGNMFIDGIYFDKALLPTTFRDIKIDEAIDWHVISAKVFLEIGLSSGKLAMSMIGVPWYLPWAASALSGTLGRVDVLDTDSQMLILSAETLFDGFTQSDIISRNTYQALKNIKNGIVPKSPDGEIVFIKNFGRGFLGKAVHYNQYLSFLYVDTFSEVSVKNTGKVKARFELTNQYYNKFSTGLLTKYSLPVVVSDSKEIEPGQTETFYVWYKKNSEGIDPVGQDIVFYLLAQTDSGIYGLDMASTRFGTTKIAINEVNASEEELKNALMYPFPIRSDIEKGNNYTLGIYIENPFDFSVEANLTQEIPSGLDIVLAANCTINNSGHWQLELGPKEKKGINIMFKFKESSTGIIEIKGAILNIYDQVNDDWIGFQSNNVNMSAYGKIDIILNKGWNLISVPLNLINNTFSYLFNKDNITAYGYKNNSWFIPREIENRLGYWVRLNECYNLTLIGTEIENKTIILNDGWNLVSYPYLSESDLNNATFKNNTVFTYANNSWQSYNPNKTDLLNTLKQLKPGYGYWVKK